MSSVSEPTVATPLAPARPPLPLEEKVAWVTGASRGLGAAIAVGMAAAGAKVAVHARREPALREVADRIAALDRDALVLVGSVSSAEGVHDAAERIRERWGTIDVLVNNAGVSPWIRGADELAQSDWDRVLDTNLRGALICSSEAARLMGTRGGAIVNISSIHAQAAAAGLAAYGVSKAAIEALTRSLAVEWADRGIRVNAIAPGYFETDMTSAVRRDDSHRERLLQRIPMGRFGTPDEVVAAAVFLASTGASYVTGTTIVVDGGWRAQ